MINRRNLLIGAGAVIAAPGFGSIAPTALAADSTPVARTAAGFVRPEWLTDAETLAASISAKSVKILALQKLEEFEASHIPGALLVRYDQTDLDNTSESSVAAWRESINELMASLAITSDDALVVYDGGNFHAARLWWLLDQIGYRQKQILDGGLPAWLETGGAVESGPAVPPAKAVEPAQAYVANEEGVATIDEVLQALESDNAYFIDARPAEDFHMGHIPGAISAPSEVNAADSGPKYWKDADDLIAIYRSIPKDGRVIPYCAGGVRSASTYFTLLQIGYPNVSLFTGSWKEWSANPDLPVEVD